MADPEGPDPDIEGRLLSPDTAVRFGAYVLVVALYYDRIYAFLRARCARHGLSESDAADLCQNTFVVFFEKLDGGTYTRTGKIAPLLFGIARNLACKLLEGKRRRERGGDCVEEKFEFDFPPYILDELGAAIFDGASKLPAWSRLVVITWLGVIQDKGYPPSPAELTGFLFDPVCQEVFGKTWMMNEQQRTLLTDAVEKALNRGLFKLQSHLIRLGYWK